MLEIKALGAPDAVSRAAFLVTYRGSRLLLDYGVELSRPPAFPLHVRPRDVDALYLSHAHLDHIGAAPLLYASRPIPVYATLPTIDLSGLLIRDFLKISGEHLPYEFDEYELMRRSWIGVEYGEVVEVPHTPFELEILDAGHVPGSSQVLINAGKHRILYTGDINTYETRLQRPAETDYEDVDVVIIESTYASEVHPDRKKLERMFIEKVEEVIDEGGVALVPAFAVGRSQEIMLILHHYRFRGNVAIDGMAITATTMMLSYGKRFFRDVKALKRAFERVEKITRWSERRRVVREPGVIIAPAGMLGGGAAIFYINRLYDSEKNGIFLVGYQVPGTPGRALLEERVIFRNGVARKVKSQVYSYRFSSHTDRRGLEEIVSRLRPGTRVIIVHGEPESREALKAVCEEYGHEVYLPRMGDTITIS